MTGRKDKDKEELFAKWKNLKKKDDKNSKEELDKVENELADK